MALAAHGVTHTGRRSTNEDAMLVDVALGLFVVADGMGGHKAGEVASALAVETIRGFIAAGAPATTSLLEDGVRRANEEILAEAGRQTDCAGMGTTVVLAVVTEQRMFFASVGDSRVYLWHTGTLTQLTQDDSWVARVLSEGASVADVRQHPMRHVLTKVVGLHLEMEPAAGECPFGPGDALLLCSDGLHGSLSDEAIATTLGAAGGVVDIAERLVERALAHGASDNVTAVVVRREA
jgi:PPM family protein phosphatase